MTLAAKNLSPLSQYNLPPCAIVSGRVDLLEHLDNGMAPSVEDLQTPHAISPIWDRLSKTSDIRPFMAKWDAEHLTRNTLSRQLRAGAGIVYQPGQDVQAWDLAGQRRRNGARYVSDNGRNVTVGEPNRVWELPSQWIRPKYVPSGETTTDLRKSD